MTKTTTIYLDGGPIELSYHASSAGSFAYTDAPSLSTLYHPKVDASGRLWGEEPLLDSFGEVVGVEQVEMSWPEGHEELRSAMKGLAASGCLTCLGQGFQSHDCPDCGR